MRHPRNFWKNEKNIIEESKNYISRTEFKKKAHRAYDAARNLNLLDKMDWLNNKNIYTDKIDTIYIYHFIKENYVYVGRTINIKLRDYQHRTTLNDSVFRFAEKNNIEIPPITIIESNLTINEGIQREIYWENYYKKQGYNMINAVKCGSVGSLASGKWNKTKCIEESKKYTSRSEFFKNSSNAYQASLKNGWLNEMTWLSTNRQYPKGYWKNKENVLNKAKEFTSKEDFQKNCPSAFIAAYKYGWINEMTWLKKQKQHKRGYWTYDNIKKEAIKYKSRSEFSKKCPSGYYQCLKHKLMNDFFPQQNNKG